MKPLKFEKTNGYKYMCYGAAYNARSKSNLDSLKSVFNVFRRKPTLGCRVL